MIPNILSPEIEWLATKWGLPSDVFEIVHRWMQAELDGSTALPLESAISDWGQAAAPAGQTADTPLVLVRYQDKIFLQSRLHFETEHAIARRILKLAEGVTSSPGLDDKIRAIFPNAIADDPQARAARTACERILTIITGGPGTGKTFTLARILALLADSDHPAGSIRIAAPAGKAADRMKASIAQSLDGLPSSYRKYQEILQRIADSSSTIHSLLGYRPDTGQCRYGVDNPLSCSALIIDECSMVDIHLWRAILDALPSGARLIVLGDPNQLTSVGQGNVFGELVRAAASPASPLHRSHVHLTEARRFKDRLDILTLARALETFDADAVTATLENSKGSTAAHGVAWIEMNDGLLPCSDFPSPIHDALETVADADTPEAALRAMEHVCILTAQREYFVGAMAMSTQIESYLQRRMTLRNHPIIINQNDPETGLRNGSVGVIHTDDDGNRRAYFAAADGSLDAFVLSKLPDFSPAWAITIHRSQGSEYDNVLVILPREESPMATRELLYTAITRAKKNVFVTGTLASARQAAITPSQRVTLLASALHQT